MKHLFIIGLLLVAFSQAAWSQNDKTPAKPQPREFEMKEGDTTYVMRRYVMALLYRGKKANKYTKEEKAQFQAGHMENIGRLAKEGKLLVAGPFGDDTDLRGIFILDCESVEEAQQLVNTDPAVIAGTLRVELHPWWTARGTVIK